MNLMMADVHGKVVRSYNMSQIKSKNTKPELLVRQFLHSQGFRYRLHVKSMPGSPDLVLPKHKAVVFVNGCFWHGHNHCKYAVIPKTRSEWWTNKINYNIVNDKKAEKALKELGWKTITVWECQLKKEKLEYTMNFLIEQINAMS